MPEILTIPLFDLYTVSQLAGVDYPKGKLPYRESYLAAIKDGRKPPTMKFKKTAAGILNRSIADLFGPQEPAS